MIGFLVGWAIRSSILIVSGALLLRVLRVKDSSIRLAAWVAMLTGSLAIPALTATLPKAHLTMIWLTTPRFETVQPEVVRVTPPPVAAPPVEVPRVAVYEAVPAPMPMISRPADGVPTRLDWALIVIVMYLLVTGALMLRSFAGLAMSLRLLRNSRTTDQATEGIEIRESDRVAAPVTLGIVCPAIVLPLDWCEWNCEKLDAVLAHERSHVQRRDPAVQLLSVIHRTLLWFSPLSWFLHKRIVQAAEEASDDAAVAATRDRASYAEVLLDFMRRGVRGESWQGLAMARYGLPEERIQRILDATTLSHGVTRWSVVAILALGSPLAYVVATAQARPEFEIADVHVSPPASIWNGFAVRVGNPMMHGGVLRAGRYELRQATMQDLIRTAYGVDADTVIGGPSWLEFDRFDVIAKAPTSTSSENVRLMLQALLADRFKLVVHQDTRPKPAFVLTTAGPGKAKGELKLKEADGSGRCPDLPSSLGPGGDIGVSCRAVTMEEFAVSLHRLAGGYLTTPVVDQTGLKGTWDIDLNWTAKNFLQQAGSGGISLFDALDKQLGLKLEPRTVPMPVLVVDSVNEKPSANPPGAATSLPPAPEFEVASIRPSQGFLDTTAAQPPRPPVEILPGGRVNIRGFSLMQLIIFAWDIYPPFSASPKDQLVGAPKWLDSVYFEVIAKASAIDGPAPLDHDDVRSMLRALLVDRFKLATHYEDRPVDVYTLVATKPKLKKADPSNRTGCKQGRAPGARDPGDGPPPSLLTCQNVTMAQFAGQLQSFASNYTHFPVLNATGINGAWDLTLIFGSPPGNGGFGVRGGGPAAPPAAGGPTDPPGGISLFDALEKQLGLKLERHRRPEPVLVIDHIEEKPTDN